MRLTILGSGTSMGVPVIGCDCAVCTSDDPRNRRLRTSALIERDDQRVLIDAGPDLRTQVLRHGIRRLDAVLLTHAHTDHVGGIDDLRPFTMRSKRAIPLYGDQPTIDRVRYVYNYAFDPTPSLSTRPALETCVIDGPFAVGDLRVTPLEVLHGSMPITGYRVGSLAYITDASRLPSSTIDQLHDLQVLVINALRFTPHPLHLTVEQAIAIVEQVRPERAYFVHITHDLDHGVVNAQLPAYAQLAYDGQVIEIDD